MSADKAPTEDDILYQTLIVPSALPSILAQHEFAALFPVNLRNNSQVAALYRALQYRRALDTDHVRGNIEMETRRGERQRRELHKSLAKDRGDQELDIDDPDRKLLLGEGTEEARTDAVCCDLHSLCLGARELTRKEVPAVENTCISGT